MKMPDLVGKSYAAATTILESYDLSYSDPPQYEYSDEVPEGKVIDQSYEAGDEISDPHKGCADRFHGTGTDAVAVTDG